MTTLREAAEASLDALKMMRQKYGEYACQACDHADVAIIKLCAALAEPPTNQCGETCERAKLCATCARELTEPMQEPVAWRFKAMIGSPWSLSDDGYYISCKRDQRYFVEALYTAPPQRKPLAEWQINDLMADIDPEDVDSWSFRQGVYAAEKHHEIKP